MLLSGALVATQLSILLLILAPPASARITRITVANVQTPTFDGVSFGAVGQYEKLRGRAFGEIDPADPRNALIADIQLAPRNARGMVEYSLDFFILKPVNAVAGKHRVLYYMNNRGNLDSPLFPSTGLLSLFNDGGGGNDPTTAADAGNGFLMRQGYTIVASGWDAGVLAGGNRLTITVPTAKNADGSPIVGPSLEEFGIDNATTMTAGLTYAAATLDKFQATLTVRAHYADPPVAIPIDGWEYVNNRTIRLLPADTSFTQGMLYEFTYLAQDPIVAGLGFAATRDLGAFLRHADSDNFGNPNPLAGSVQALYSFGISQPARFMRDFLHLGFNEDEQGRRLFDGMLNWLGAGSGIFLNYRFAQPARTHRQRIGRWYPEREFPFANQVLFDPVSGKTDGRLRRCQTNDTCPRIFEVNTDNEYWVKTGSLLHTDTLGNDLPDPLNVRFYFLAGIPHVASTTRGICQQPGNPLVPNPAIRALLLALDEWISDDQLPPESRVPRRGDGTLVPSLPQEGVGFPRIPGVTYSGLMTTGDLFEFGASFNYGILMVLPPIFRGSPYPGFVPRTDIDGNGFAGVRLPQIAVPLATYSGWSLRAVEFGGDDLCDHFGQGIDFPQTAAERVTTGDTRLSIEERYPNHGKYVSAVADAANELLKQRLLLPEDVERYIEAAAQSGVGK
ncbi:MAG: alpha/beta hydrolase domain-containing protein [Bryobacteraceae bacterium]